MAKKCPTTAFRALVDWMPKKDQRVIYHFAGQMIDKERKRCSGVVLSFKGDPDCFTDPDTEQLLENIVAAIEKAPDAGN